MLPQKNFKNLHIAVAILVLFEQFFKESLSYFRPLTLSASPMFHFVSTVSMMHSEGD